MLFSTCNTCDLIRAVNALAYTEIEVILAVLINWLAIIDAVLYLPSREIHQGHVIISWTKNHRLVKLTFTLTKIPKTDNMLHHTSIYEVIK